MKKINMSYFGLSQHFLNLSKKYYDNLTVGRIISQEKGLYHTISEDGEQISETSGKFRYQTKTISDFPAVGDFVMIECQKNNSHSIIHHILPRKSAFIRKAAGTPNKEQIIAANIDMIFICMSLNNDFNLRRLERYLSICWESGAVPVVVLTKLDICPNLSEKILKVKEIAVGVDILTTSAMHQDGYMQLLPYIKKGITIAFIGSSGVGKSTLINLLINKNYMNINGLRNDDKGRHTTTRRELILIESGGIVIDTPGMRELGIWNITEGIDKAFSDIEKLAEKCKFKDCQHITEPGCNILCSIKDGQLTLDRWKSYQKLKAEKTYTENPESYLASKQHKLKNISKMIKQMKDYNI